MSSEEVGSPATRLATVVLVGNYGVGKTTMYRRLAAQAERQAPGRDAAYLKLPDTTKVKLMDTCDMERFDNKSLTGSYYRDASCVLLVADATNLKSIQSLSNWKESAAAYAPKAKMILVINKIDSRDADEILLSSIESYRVQLGCFFSVPLSARTGQGINTLLDRIGEVCRVCRSQARRETRESIIHLHKVDVKKKSKCKC